MRRLRLLLRWIAAAAAVIAVALGALLLWLGWNPFEGRAGPLDAWVPARADAVIRFHARGLSEAPALRALLDGPAGSALRERVGLGDAEDAVAEIDAALATIPFWGEDPATVAGDLAGGECLVAAAGGDLLLLSRVSARIVALERVASVREAPRASLGVRFDEASEVYELPARAAPARFAARRRDVLLAATSRELLGEALALAEGAEGAIAARPEYALDAPPVPQGARVHAWAVGRRARDLLGEPPLAAELWRALTQAPLRADADLSSPDAIAVEARTAADAAAFPGVAAHAAAAARRADPAEAFAWGALPLRAEEAVAALFEAQPPARRRLLDDLLRERGSDAERVIAEVARPLADGVGFVLERPALLDALRLDDAAGDVRLPIPRTEAVFLLRSDAAPLVEAVSRNAAAFFGDDGPVVEERAGGTLVVRAPDDVTFGPEWDLLRPQLEVGGREAHFTTLPGPAAPHDARPSARPSGLLAELHVDAAHLRRHLLDQRWTHADRATWHDWAKERREVRRGIVQDPATARLPPEEVQRREDEEIAARLERRRRVEFPEALRRYARSLAWMEGFAQADAQAVRTEGRVVLSLRVGIHRP